jgi:hypothetical protein
MSGTLDLPERGYFTPPRQRTKISRTPGTDYSPAEKLKISTPELLAQAKTEQDMEEVPKKKGGKTRRRKGRKARKTRHRKSRK